MNNYKYEKKTNEDKFNKKSNCLVNHSSKIISDYIEEIEFNYKKRNPDFSVLAIDGGGTKTLAKVVNINKDVIFTAEAGTSNYHVVGKKEVANTLQCIIKKLTLNLNKDDVLFDIGVFAIAGIDTYEDLLNVKEVITETLGNSPVKFNKIILENDALSILQGAIPRHPGVILISGTGSIAFAHNGKKYYGRSGGWGHRLDDEGSGYWIGKEAIKSILKSYDGRGDKTLLSEMVIKHLQIRNYEELFHWVYSNENTAFNISELAKIVEEAYRLNDKVSKNILDRAIEELYYLIEAVVKKANILDGKFKLMLMGGVLENSKYVNDKLIYKLEKEMPEVSLVTNNNKPIDYVIKRGVNLV